MPTAKPPVSFDLDGTLIDSAPDLRAAANRMLADIGKPPLSLDQVRSFIGNGVPKLVERCLRAAGANAALDADQMTDSFSRHYTAAPTALTVLYPGAADALHALKSAGHTLSICTNKPIGPTRIILEAFGLHQIFDQVIGGDSLPIRKPDPAPLRAAFNGTTGLFVGDSETDAETAHNTGVPFLLFDGGYRKSPVEDLKPAAVFSHHADLPDLVARLI